MVPSKENPRLIPSALLYTRTLVQITTTSCLEQCNGLLPLIFLLSLFTPWPAYPFKNLRSHQSSWNGFPHSQGKSAILPDPSLPKASPTTPLPAPCWCPAACGAVALLPQAYSWLWNFTFAIPSARNVLPSLSQGAQSLTSFKSFLKHYPLHEGVPGQPTLNCNPTLSHTPFPPSLPYFSPQHSTLSISYTDILYVYLVFFLSPAFTN